MKGIKDLYKKLDRYLHNIFWILGDRVFSMFITFGMTVMVARYLGPAEYGLLAYALSLTSLFAVAGHMGLSGLVVREIVKKPEQHAETLGTTYLLKLLGMVAGYVALLLYALVYEGIGSTPFNLVLITGAVLIFKPAEVVGFWFEAFVKARYVTMARLGGLLCSAVFQIGLVLSGMTLVYFATASLLQAIVVACLLFYLFGRTALLRITDWRFSSARAKELLSQGWKVYLGSIFAVLYLKIDQVMLRWYAGQEEVGIYAVAAQLSEAWYFVPAAIVASFFPKLIKLREESEELFYTRMQQLLDVLFLLAVSIAALTTLMADWIINTFFGVHYAGSAAILVIHTWAALFIFMRVAFSKWILIEDALMFSLVTQGLGALLNIVLNVILIPKFGGIGAAYGTLASYAMASYFALYVYGKTRKVFWLMTWSMLSPVRYGTLFINRFLLR